MAKADAGSPHIGEDEGRRALIVDGVVQSIAMEDACGEMDVWRAQVPDTRLTRALILGLGGGTVAQLLTRRFGPLPIVGVERDPTVVDLARSHLGLDLPNLTIVLADAFTFVQECRERFDLICVDLYRGGLMERRALSKPFLRDLERLLAPSGTAVFNLFREQRTSQRLVRLEQFFRVAKTVEVGRNVIAHCRRK